MEGTVKRFKCIVSIFSLVLLSLLFMSALSETGDAYGDNSKNELGKRVYEERCMICHGTKGDGKGLVGVMKRLEKSGRVILVEPRDFTSGVFRFRSTATGCLPSDEDLLRRVDTGITRSFMPAHKDELNMDEKKAVIGHIKTFSTRWKEEEPCKSITVKKKPKWVGSSSSIEKGAKIYKEIKCWECHGYDGRGKGPKSDQLKDDWGKPIVPFNFTAGALKRGTAAEDVYITFTSGLDGTGMPSYEDSLKEEERWHLVSYILKLMGRVK